MCGPGERPVARARKGSGQTDAAAGQWVQPPQFGKTTVSCECRYQYTVFKEASSGLSDILPGHENIDVDASTSSINWVGDIRARFDIVARDGAPLPAGRYTVSAWRSWGASSLDTRWRLVADACGTCDAASLRLISRHHAAAAALAVAAHFCPALPFMQVHMRPLNTYGTGSVWDAGTYVAAQRRAAVGVPTQPLQVHLSTVLNENLEPQTGKLRIT